MQRDAIPGALRDREQWICWRTECRECGERLAPTTKTCSECEEKATKKPVRPDGSGFASSTDADTWGTLDAAVDAHEGDAVDTDGVGFVFDAEGLVCGVDLDDCRDPETGEVDDWAEAVVDALDSFTEVSPSGTGLHVYCFGFIPDGGYRNDDIGIEMYDSARYFTVTGDHVDETPEGVNQRQDALRDVHAEHIADDQDEDDGAEPPAEPVDIDDAELINRAMGAANGDEFERLWNGDTSMHENDHSRADMALLCHLAFWTGGDRGRMERLFERSGLVRDKWRERPDYRDRSIDAAIAQTTEFYEPNDVPRGPVDIDPDPPDVPEDGPGEEAEAEAAPDGGAAAAAPPGGDDAPAPDPPQQHTWEDVMELFDRNENGTTTRAYNVSAQLLDREHTFVAIRDTDELYYYHPERGFYVRKGETFIAELLEERIPGYVNISRRRNITDQVKGRNYMDIDAFTPPQGKVNVENGVLDLETREREPHDAEYYFTSQLQTPYDPEAETQRWGSFLEETIPDEFERRKLEEYIGYCLEVWHHNREKNLFIVGPRQSGKSTFAHVVQALFGTAPTVTNLTPQQIADTQFDAASLQEAMLNAVNDINATKIEDTGTLKRVFSGERLKLERKHQDAYFGAPKAKHMFTANWLPTVVGQDESLYRRVLIAEFPNKIDDEDRDEQLKSTLEGELSGVLNEALDARERLHEQNGFTNDRDDSATRRKWDSWRDAHKRFLYQQFEITGDSDDVVEKSAYYRAYKEFAGRQGYELKPQQGVTKSLKWVPEISVRDDSYAGLAWRDEDVGDPEATAAQQMGLGDTQDKRVRKVLGWVDDFSTPTSAAPIDDLLDYAEELDFDRDNVSHTIEELLTNGTLNEPEDGAVRRT